MIASMKAIFNRSIKVVALGLAAGGSFDVGHTVGLGIIQLDVVDEYVGRLDIVGDE